MNILLVDDSLTVRMDLSEAFEESGFPVRPCASLSQARDALARQHRDVMLPGGSATELLRVVREGLKQSLVMLLSVRSRIPGLPNGADEYLSLP